MYKLLLILKYLRRKLAPMFAALAVTLCTAMVIIVISVMGGFLEMMRGAARTLTGDVTISSGLTGFPHYQKLIAELEKMPEVAAATPVVRAYGLVKMDERVVMVEVEGVQPEGLDKVNNFRKTLYWQTEHLLQRLDDHAPREETMSPHERERFRAEREEMARLNLEEAGMQMRPPPAWGQRPGIVPGIEVSPWNYRDQDGKYILDQRTMLAREAMVTVLPMTAAGGFLEPATAVFTVVNEFKSGLYEVDAKRVYVPFNMLQKMLNMQEDPEFDWDTGLPTGRVVPGRTSEVVIAAAPGIDSFTLKERIEPLLHQFEDRHPDIHFLRLLTWQERHATFLGAVEKEKFLLTILFAIISVVAVAMIGVIFYMIVLEKTRDIGVVRAIGASGAGVAGIFLGYGLAIGIVGAALGLGLASLIVHYINEIQDYLATRTGETLFVLGWALGGLLLGAVGGLLLFRRRSTAWVASTALLLAAGAAAGAWTYLRFAPELVQRMNRAAGFRMWDPQIYYFDQIPSRLDPAEVKWILLAAIIASVIGAIVPAILASRLDPVEALRYE